jgi:hypothetical protein
VQHAAAQALGLLGAIAAQQAGQPARPAGGRGRGPGRGAGRAAAAAPAPALPAGLLFDWALPLLSRETQRQHGHRLTEAQEVSRAGSGARLHGPLLLLLPASCMLTPPLTPPPPPPRALPARRRP